jgi:translation initiation factor 2B subunit (eIF-2B alpha/beta/delta family)
VGETVEAVGRRIAAIRRDREHGATFLAVEAVRVLGEVALAGGPEPEWMARLLAVADELASAQPAMVAMRNAVSRLLRSLASLGPAEGPLRAPILAARIVDELLESAGKAADAAARLIGDRSVVATCSYSSAVIRTVQRAHNAGKTLRVMVFETAERSDAPGRRLARELRAAGLAVELFGPAASARSVGRAHLTMVGADAVTPAFVVNGAPTLALAEAASGRSPFYVVCETAKFAPCAFAPSGYDLVPLRLVRCIVTEQGVSGPADARFNSAAATRETWTARP